MLLGLCSEEQRGAALVIALIVMTMLSILTIGSLEMLMLNVQIASNHMQDLQALYIADAGIEHTISVLRSVPDFASGTYGPIVFPTGSGNSYTVILANSYASTGTAIITSTGIVSDFQRSLEAQVEIAGSSVPYSVNIAYWKEI